MTLTQATIGTDTLLKKVLLVLAGTIFIAIAAQISVPFFPVPMTLQTLAILMIGLTFGARLGAVTVLAYLAEGALGLPVFANFGAGLAYMAGPTLGFLVGFVVMAYVAGLAAGRGVVAMVIASLIAAALIYIPGLGWPLGVANAFGVDAGWAALSAEKVWAGFAAPFLLGDAAKAVVAALVVSGAYKAFAKS